MEGVANGVGCEFGLGCKRLTNQIDRSKRAEDGVYLRAAGGEALSGDDEAKPKPRCAGEEEEGFCE